MTRPTRLIAGAIFAAALGGPIAAAQIDPSLMPSPTPTPIQSLAGDWGMALDLAIVTPAAVIGTTPALENEAGITVAAVRKQFWPRPGKKDPVVPPA
jgi:hypothetical protein